MLSLRHLFFVLLVYKWCVNWRDQSKTLPNKPHARASSHLITARYNRINWHCLHYWTISIKLNEQRKTLNNLVRQIEMKHRYTIGRVLAEKIKLGIKSEKK